MHRVRAAAVTGAVLGPVGLLPGPLKKGKATAFVVLADGTTRQRKLDGHAAVRNAQRDAVRFNVLAREA